MRKLLIFAFAIFLSSVAYSQNLCVNEFKSVDKSIGANIELRTDLNNRPCALIKVEFPVQGVKFQGNVIGDVSFKDNAYFVFLSPGSSYLQVKSPNASSFRIDFREFGFKRVEEGAIYCLILSDEGELSAEDLYNRAMSYDSANDITNSVKYLQLSADKNYAPAECMLGVIYYAGFGDIQKDYVLAFQYFSRSAAQSYDEAIFYKATCYYDGNGVEQNLAEAFNLWKSIADKGHIRAQNNVGMCYMNGVGISKNATEGIKWLELAAEQGYSEAQFSIGNAYFTGNGVSTDYSKAAKWFEMGAAQNNPACQYALGVFYENGLGVTKDIDKAIDYYKKSSDQGTYEAKKALLRFKNN